MNFDAFTADILKKKYRTRDRGARQHWTGPIGAQTHAVVFLNIQKRIVYLHTHKNASTFVRQFFQPLISGHPEDVPGVPWSKEGCLQANYRQVPGFKDWDNFWIVRNPTDRIISAFLRGKKIGWIDYRHDHTEHVFTIFGETSRIVALSTKPKLEEEFEAFIKRLQSNYFDPHVFPQVLTLADKDLDLADVDEFILFDNLMPELQDYSNRHGMGWDVLSKKAVNQQNLRDKQKIQKYVGSNRRIRAKIEALYPEDFLIYNYIKELRSGT